MNTILNTSLFYAGVWFSCYGYYRTDSEVIFLAALGALIAAYSFKKSHYTAAPATMTSEQIKPDEQKCQNCKTEDPVKEYWPSPRKGKIYMCDGCAIANGLYRPRPTNVGKIGLSIPAPATCHRCSKECTRNRYSTDSHCKIWCDDCYIAVMVKGERP